MLSAAAALVEAADAPATAEPRPASVAAGSCPEGRSLSLAHEDSAALSAGVSHGGELCADVGPELGLGTVPEDPAPEPLTVLPVSRVALRPPKELGPELDPPNVESELGAPNEVGPELAELGVDFAADVLEDELSVWVAGRAFAPPGAAAVRSLWQ